MTSTSLLLLCLGLLQHGESGAADITFRRHTVNADSNYSACAAIDVNDDGRLDIVAGGWWYQAPSWQAHKLRDVELIRGRYDDYSNLPLDVDGDGDEDLVSANYRSQSLYWVEQPEQATDLWQKQTIDTPGAMETGRLYDIDGDGQLDVLPNGMKFAAWWELIRPAEGAADDGPRWIRHDLPQEVAGHGIGFGDINGDGRGDIVGPGGWLEAPEDARRDRWFWHPEFKLHHDGSIPILVMDADGDADADLIWGRGHDIGVYWLEQRSEAGERRWEMHAIDTSCSGMHSLLLGDVDNDGREDVIAGKRYMGHDGKDPGEYDPLVVYWYKFDTISRTWHRHLISSGGGAGFGLDPKAVDLDADGDLDFIGSGRSGLFWFENQLVNPGSSDSSSSATKGQLARDDLLQYLTEDGEVERVASPDTWALRKADVLSNMQDVMGPLPAPRQRVPLDVEVLGEERLDHYTRRSITFAAEPGDRVPALLLIPHDLQGPVPAMLCLHPTTPVGKRLPAGMEGPITRHYAHQLAERGYVCIVPDYPSFGDYQYDFAADGRQYVSGSMKAIWNNIRAVDVLESLAEVDRDRIGVIGHSLGGHNGLFTACFDQRLRAIVTSCGFTAFHDYYGGDLAGWTSARYMPRIRDVYGNDPNRMPFDFFEVLACMAPRPVFINAPLHDDNFDVEGVRKVIAQAEKVYALLGAKDKLTVVYPDSDHTFPDPIRAQAYDWLDRQLGR